MQTIDRYLTTQSLRAIALVAASLTSMMLLFALFDELAESADRYGFDDALNYLWRTLPRRLEDLLLYSVFIGYLAALGQLAEQGELTALRAAGVSPQRFMQGLAPSLILCLGLSFALSEYIAPKAEQTAEVAKLNAQYGRDAMRDRGGFWIRDNQLYMHVQTMSDKDGGTLWGVRQYWLNESQQLQRSLEAEYATYDATLQNWLLHNGRQTELTPKRTTVSEFSVLTWDNDITPKLLTNQAFLEPKKMSLLGLSDQINFLRQQQLQATQYELALWSRILKPLNYFGMALLALAIVLGPLRSTGLGPRLALGLFVGLTFKYLQDLFAPMSVVFALPTPLAVALPITLYLLFGWALIRRYA
jgi:lipopolysaccharide export system permease protein